MIDCSSCTVPTDNLGGVCSFCLDYATEHGPRLNVNDPCWITAKGTDTLVEVYRSPLVDMCAEDEAVFKFIEYHGLSLVYTETDLAPSWMYGQRIREIYA